VALAPGELRSAIERRLGELEVPVREIFCWNTDGRLASVAVAGMVPSCRFLFLSDRLLQQLTESQILALVAHEAAHCRRRHLPRLALSLAFPLFLLLLVSEIWPDSGVMRGVAVLLPGLGLAVWALAHGQLARAFEIQADWEACVSLAGHRAVGRRDVAGYAATLDAASPRDPGDWLHPSAAQREARLVEFQRDPAAREAWERTLRRWTAAQLVSVALLAALWAWVQST
jgi:Zn-dependent protease with chaperone function